jgi:importin subunit alpha-6/7
MLDSIWCLSYCSDAGASTIPAIMETGIVPKIIELCVHPEPAIGLPSLRTCGNFVTGEDEQTEVTL